MPLCSSSALHYRDELRESRLKALRDAESFEDIVFVLERIGVHLTDKIGLGLGGYKQAISQLAGGIPETCDDWHSSFDGLYELVCEGRNDALHQGAFARHLTTWAVQLATIVEDALVEEATQSMAAQIKDFMIQNPVRAYMWQPMSSIRQIMLANSFSYLPVAVGEQCKPSWHLISDFAVVSFLRRTTPGKTKREQRLERLERLSCKLQEARKEKPDLLCEARICRASDLVESVLRDSQGKPVLVLGNPGELRGLVTPFDLL